MKQNEEKITKNFAMELLNGLFLNDEIHKNMWVSKWEELGYIKQTREEEIRDIINSNEYICSNIAIELIEILDKKIEILENENNNNKIKR